MTTDTGEIKPLLRGVNPALADTVFGKSKLVAVKEAGSPSNQAKRRGNRA